MKAATEAVYLPMLFLTVALLGGLRVDDRVTFVPPPLFALVLGMMLFGVLVRGRVLAPERLMSASRPPLENLNGLVVILSTFFAAAQIFNLVTPETGLPFLLFNVFLFVLLVNTLAAFPDRVSVLRSMAVISLAKGLYHWAQVTGFIGGEEEAFENQTMAWQTATIYFAVIELVAAVGLWLATPWGAVVWLTTVVSMAVIELMFPGIYGGSLVVVGVEAVMLAAYLALAFLAARERPP